MANSTTTDALSAPVILLVGQLVAATVEQAYAAGAAQDRLRTEQAGFDLHLTKPVDLGTVHGALALRLEQLQAA